MFEMEIKYGSRIDDEDLYLSSNSDATKKQLDPKYYLLCPPTIECFHVSSSRRYDININKLQTMVWKSKLIDGLVLESDKKTLLMRVVASYSDDAFKNFDFIKDKGRGLTILLHGPPGVGKTYTAECLAEFVKKPLIPLSVADLVAEEESIEDRLVEAFGNASRLSAMLLLDEADVVLEARSFEDMRRNGIVSSRSIS
jgi:AAA+ superfamily predicted ATPase